MTTPGTTRNAVPPAASLSPVSPARRAGARVLCSLDRHRGTKGVVSLPDAVGSERDEVIGREPELAAIERFLEPRTWPRALQLEGDPGIGKTTLWAACGSARARGITVLGGRRPGPVTVRDRLVAFVPVSFVA